MGNNLTFLLIFSKIIEGDRSFEAELIHSEYVSPFYIVGLKSTEDFSFMAKLQDLTGQRFGRLTVIKRVENDKRGNSRWLCRCDCGNEKVVSSHNLKNGHAKSCGCFRRDIAKTKLYTHGKYKTRLFGIWTGIKNRCYNKKETAYKHYGGRGITMCDKWLNDFQAFYDWSIANGYDEKAKKYECTIDRIDNNKGYSLENCRWVTQSIQNRNKRTNNNLTYNGETHCLKEWAEILGVNYKSFYNRFFNGWSLDRIFNQPYRKRG